MGLTKQNFLVTDVNILVLPGSQHRPVKSHTRFHEHSTDITRGRSSLIEEINSALTATLTVSIVTVSIQWAAG